MTAHENQSAAIYGCCFGLNIFTGLTQLVLMSQGAGRQVVRSLPGLIYLRLKCIIKTKDVVYFHNKCHKNINENLIFFNTVSLLIWATQLKSFLLISSDLPLYFTPPQNIPVFAEPPPQPTHTHTHL